MLLSLPSVSPSMNDDANFVLFQSVILVFGGENHYTVFNPDFDIEGEIGKFDFLCDYRGDAAIFFAGQYSGIACYFQIPELHVFERFGL